MFNVAVQMVKVAQQMVKVAVQMVEEYKQMVKTLLVFILKYFLRLKDLKKLKIIVIKLNGRSNNDMKLKLSQKMGLFTFIINNF